jgi:AbrB-like transcriptional regulator
MAKSAVSTKKKPAAAVKSPKAKPAIQATAEKIIPLRGSVLKAKLKELKSLSKTETAKGCGYYTIGKDGKTKVNLKQFYDAVLQSEGINVDETPNKSRRGREASYQVTVHQNGQILIGAAYTKELNLVPGDEFEIKLGYKHIHLKAIMKQSQE